METTTYIGGRAAMLTPDGRNLLVGALAQQGLPGPMPTLENLPYFSVAAGRAALRRYGQYLNDAGLRLADDVMRTLEGPEDAAVSATPGLDDPAADPQRIARAIATIRAKAAERAAQNLQQREARRIRRSKANGHE